MFGWEFPPYVSGGLGVACYNITKSLDPLVDRLFFVMPKNDINQSLFHKTALMGADSFKEKPFALNDSQTEEQEEVESVIKKYKIEEKQRKISFLPVESQLDAYAEGTQGVFHEEQQSFFNAFFRQEEKKRLLNKAVPNQVDLSINFDFSNPLFRDVMAYSSKAACFAMMVKHDVIHAHDWLTIPAAFEAKRYSQKPLVLHVHATEYDRSGSGMNTLIYEIERFGVKHADRVIAVSQYTKDILIQHYAADASKIEVVHNGVAPKLSNLLKSSVKKTVKEKIVLYLGRLTFQKGPDYFIRSAKRVLEKRKDIRFVVAGSGDMMPWLVEQVNEWGLGDHFYFTGFLNDVLVERLFRISDVYVMPSVSEPFGIAPLEALYYGVPVVLSKSSGVSEVLDHVLKVDFWDIDEMANKMLAILDYPALRKHLMKGVEAELPTINWDDASKKIFKIYKQVNKEK